MDEIVAGMTDMAKPVVEAPRFDKRVQAGLTFKSCGGREPSPAPV